MEAKIITEHIKNELDIGLSSNLIKDHNAKGIVRKIAIITFNGTKNTKKAEVP
jgi:hypothetical protein